MSVIIKDMDKADRCADCQLLQTYQEHPFASVEMWCGVTDERIDNMQMVLPTCPIIADRKTENSSEKPNNSTISKMEQVDKDINVRSKDCETCKWGEWYRKGYDITMMDDECGGCCSWNSKWTPKTEPQTERSE